MTREYFVLFDCDFQSQEIFYVLNNIILTVLVRGVFNDDGNTHSRLNETLLLQQETSIRNSRLSNSRRLTWCPNLNDAPFWSDFISSPSVYFSSWWSVSFTMFPRDILITLATVRSHSRQILFFKMKFWLTAYVTKLLKYSNTGQCPNNWDTIFSVNNSTLGKCWWVFILPIISIKTFVSKLIRSQLSTNNHSLFSYVTY